MPRFVGVVGVVTGASFRGGGWGCDGCLGRWTDGRRCRSRRRRPRCRIRPGGMRGALRRPTRVGVLDQTIELLGLGLRFSGKKMVLVPLHNPPQAVRAFRRADPKFAAEPPF